MYNRDYVRKLERELELSGDNRFKGWHSSSSKREESVDPKRPEHRGDGKPGPRAAVARAR